MSNGQNLYKHKMYLTMKLPQLLIFIIPLYFSCIKHDSKVKVQSIKVEAPFEMPVITVPDFSACEQYLITDYGAIADDKEATSAAIQKAIDLAHTNNGGVVVIPKGEWITKKIHLKSNINLHLDEGARLVFTSDPEDYLPAVFTTWEGMECYNYSPLVYAFECENIAITGQGELYANMDTWNIWRHRPPAHLNSLKWLYELASSYSPVEERNMVNDTSNLRPHFIQLNRCNHVLIEDISIKNSPFWTLHPYLSNDIVIRNVKINAHGHNNDGVDPEMSQNMLIENCFFDQGDDAIAVKSGRNQDAWRLNTPTKNLVIRNCSVKNGHQLLAIGSELSGGIENVFIDSCIVADGASMFHLVFIKTNERRGGYVKNIYVSNIRADKMRDGILGIETDVLYQWRDLVPTIERRLTSIENISLQNVQANDVNFISRIEGQEELPIKNVHLKNVTAEKVWGTVLRNANVIDFIIE